MYLVIHMGSPNTGESSTRVTSTRAGDLEREADRDEPFERDDHRDPGGHQFEDVAKRVDHVTITRGVT